MRQLAGDASGRVKRCIGIVWVTLYRLFGDTQLFNQLINLSDATYVCLAGGPSVEFPVYPAGDLAHRQSRPPGDVAPRVVPTACGPAARGP